ncbi:RidA family protein [Aliihoeflea sp. PC F10.4]
MTRRTIVPVELKPVYDQWHFAPAVISNGFIFCSGIIGTSVDGKAPDIAETGALSGAGKSAAGDDASLASLVAVRDPQAQFATAFEALRAILEEAGASLADIVELTSYHVDMAAHMETFMRVRDRYLSDPYPAWTAIGVSELIVPGGLVELRAIAAAPK